MLTACGRYHWSCRERHHRLGKDQRNCNSQVFDSSHKDNLHHGNQRLHLWGRRMEGLGGAVDDLPIHQLDRFRRAGGHARVMRRHDQRGFFLRAQRAKQFDNLFPRV